MDGSSGIELFYKAGVPGGQHSAENIQSLKAKKNLPFKGKVFDKERQRLTLPGFTPVPSARVGLTTLFGMGRGGPHRCSHLKVLRSLKRKAQSLKLGYPLALSFQLPAFSFYLISLTVLMKE